MKRDMDLVREMLLAMEARDDGFRNIDELHIADRPRDALWHHLSILEDAGFVTRGTVAVYTGVGIRATKRNEFPGSYRMTWEGHDFLDSVRDPEVWKETKSGLSRVGGWTAELMKDAAKAYLKMKAKDVLGLDL